MSVCEALLLRPLQHDPAAMEKFRAETLYAPLSGSKESKRQAQRDALAAMGVSWDEVERKARASRQK